MMISAPCLLALCHAATAAALPEQASATQTQQQIVDVPVLGEQTATGPQIGTAAVPDDAAASALADDALRIGGLDVLKGGKLLLTNGVTTVEGTSGGGIARWATIAGRQMPGGIGLSGHATAIELPDFGWRSFGAAIGFGDRLEISFARTDLDTRAAGALLGLGRGYTFNQNVFGAKLRVTGDLIYGEPWLPQIAVGIEHKRSPDGAIVRALGAADDHGTDYVVSATKLLLGRSVLVNATARYTKANQLGLLGFGSAAGAGYRLQFEGSIGHQLSRRAVIGAEYRTKPNNLGLGEDDWIDLFAVYALTDNLTLTAAYVDLGSIATFSGQRGGLLSAQIAF